MRHGGSGTLASILPNATKNHRNLCKYRLQRLEQANIVTRSMAPSAKRQWQYYINVESVKVLKESVVISSNDAYRVGDGIMIDFGDVVYIHRHSSDE